MYVSYIVRTIEHIGEGNGTPLQYSCLENPMDGGAWYATVHGITKSWTRLSDFAFLSCICKKTEAVVGLLTGAKN